MTTIVDMETAFGVAWCIGIGAYSAARCMDIP